MSVAGKQRARSFTSEEKTLLLQLANAEKAYLKGRFGPTITKKGKQGKWKHIAQELNGMNGYGDRTGDDCLKKYDNMVNELKKQERDRMKYRKATGGGPARKTQALLEAETACLSNLPLEQITGIEGGHESGTHSRSCLDDLAANTGCSVQTDSQEDLFDQQTSKTDELLGSEEYCNEVEVRESAFQSSMEILTRDTIPKRLRMPSAGTARRTTTIVLSQTQTETNANPPTTAAPIQSKRTISRSERDKEFKAIGSWNDKQLSLLTDISQSLKDQLAMKFGILSKNLQF